MNIVDPKITFMTSRDFNQDTARAKRVAQKGPVFITTRGITTHVLITKKEFDSIETGEKQNEHFVSLAKALAQEEGGDFDYEFPEFKGKTSLMPPAFD